eukprot:3939238-Ditylum_brightwellii.AAC.1
MESLIKDIPNLQATFVWESVHMSRRENHSAWDPFVRSRADTSELRRKLAPVVGLLEDQHHPSC